MLLLSVNCQLLTLTILISKGGKRGSLHKSAQLNCCTAQRMKQGAALILFLHVSTTLAANLVNYDFEKAPDSVVYDDDQRTRGFKDYKEKDFVVGGLFAVHSPATGSAGGKCSSELVRSGAERTEAFLYALDSINSDQNLLPGLKLGYDIRDTCVSENIALDETADMLFSTGTGELCTAAETISSGMMAYNSSVLPAVAIIGPTSSQVALSVASLLRLFTKPEISYAVSSPTFNNRDRYSYFYRTHPPDDQEVRAIIDLILTLDWNYVTVIHSNNAYGDPALDIFRQLAEEVQICIDMDISLDDDYHDADYLEVATRLVNESQANAVVFFASLSYVEQFMQQFTVLQEGGMTRSFVWIGSSSWVQASSITDKYSDAIAGMFGYVVHTDTQSNFNDYFSRLTLNSNKRNPWFPEYYTDYFNCTLDSTCGNNTPVTDQPEYIQRNYIQLVIDAVYSIAHALNNFLNDNCDKPISWDSSTQTCTGQSEELTGSKLRSYLQNVNFTSPSGNRVHFDKFGNVDGQYTLLNYQKNGSKYEFVTTGEWISTHNQLNLYDNGSLQFGIDDNTGQPLTSLESGCQSCPTGHIRVHVQSSCCGTCMPCYGNNYTDSSTPTECSSCPDNEWGNNPITGSDSCNDIPKSYLNPSDGFGILLIIFGVFGLICVIAVCVAVGIFWKNTVIKSSGREQMILLLVGIALSFIVTVFFVVRPSITVCFFQRFGIWFCFSLVLSALLIKLIRITRIFLNLKKTVGRTKFIEWHYQVIFTFLLVALQMVLVVISLVVVYPEATENVVLNSENTLNTPVVQVVCASSHIAVLIVQILVYSALLIATNILAILTIRFPENFNEARYVAFATFSIFLIWIGFLQTYFAVDSTYRVAVLCFAIQLTSLAVLFCLFVPRIFIMVVNPYIEKSETPTAISSSVAAMQRTSFAPVTQTELKDRNMKDEFKHTMNGQKTDH